MKDGETLEQALLKDIESDFFPSSPSPNTKTNDVVYAIIDEDHVNAAYFDLAGRFPQRSSRGNQYVMVGYHYVSNEIWGVPLRNREAQTIHDGFCTLHDRYEAAGIAPNTYVLDNEKSALLISAFKKKSITYQLVPPHHHNNNLAERAI